MIEMKVHIEGLDGVQRMLGNAGKQARFATAVALTRTAKKGADRLGQEMQRQFDRPTPWIAKGTFSSGAKPATLEAKFGVKDRQSRYVLEHFTAGARGQKPYERVLRGLGILPDGYRAVPGAGLKLDGRGNPNRAQLKEAIGGVKSRMQVAKGKGKRMKLIGYFAIQPGASSRLVPGIYWTSGREIKPVLIFVNAAHYRKRIELVKLAEKLVAQEFQSEFSKAFEQAMRSAK